MSGTTSVPPIQFTPTGVTAPTDAQILAGVLADMNAAFGGKLNPGLSTPQGQLATSMAAIKSDADAQFLNFVNQVDPASADGFMQDAIGRLYFLERRPATPTTVQVNCMGKQGVVIAQGSLVKDANGNLYACTQAGTIPSGGSVTLPFAAQINGPTACPAGAISGAPYRTIPGWDRASNAVDGVPGTLVENRAEFEYRRQQSVAKNGRGTPQAIYGAVFDVVGVTDAYVIDNVENTPVAVGVTNYTLAPKSIYVAVAGGANADIANAIWAKKDGGAGYNGNTTVTVQDTSGYSNPIPTYTVKFQRPTDTPIYFAINVQNLGPQSTAAVTAAIQAAIISAFGGGDGGQRARIGSQIFASRFFAAIAGAATVGILSTTVGLGAFPVSTSVTMGIDQRPTISANNIAVTFSS